MTIIIYFYFQSEIRWDCTDSRQHQLPITRNLVNLTKMKFLAIFYTAYDHAQKQQLASCATNAVGFSDPGDVPKIV